MDLTPIVAFRAASGPEVGPPPAAAVRAWAVGQTLSAVVVSATRGGAVLDVGGAVIHARSELPVQPGEALALRVEQLRPAVLLRVLAPVTLASEEASARLLRTSLPRQVPLGQAFAALLAVLDHPSLQGGGALAQTAAALRALLGGLPDRAHAADPERLRALVRRSGIFLEAQLRALAEGAPSTVDRADLKRELTALRARVDAERGHGLPAEARALADTLEQAVEAGIGRIETNQALSARAHERGAMAWYLDLPLAAGDAVESLALRIRRERRGDEGEAYDVWSVDVTVHPPGLAEVHARIALTPRGVLATLTTPDRSTFARLHDQIGALAQGLEEAALAVVHVGCRCAEPEREPALCGLPDLLSASA